MQLTTGLGVKKPQGKRIDFTNIIPILSDHTGLEAWWSPHIYKGDYREGENWEGSCAVVIDIDYRERLLFPTPEEVIEIQNIKWPGTHYHLTPHGLRLIWLFSEMITDRERYHKRYIGLRDKVAPLVPARYKIDEGASGDFARLFYTPNATAKGVKRAAEVLCTTPAPKSEGIVTTDWNSFNRECPFCQHKDCFGPMKDDPSKWFCFSSNHEGWGLKTPSGHIGDIHDYEKLRTGKTTYKHSFADLGRSDLECEIEPTENELIAQKKTQRNSFLGVYKILLKCPTVNEGRTFAYNEMTQRIEIDGKEATDKDISRIRLLIGLFFGSKDDPAAAMQQSKSDIYDAIELLAVKKSYHPVKRYLEGLIWDKKPRIYRVLKEIFPGEPSELEGHMLAKWFISAVARAMRPGCKVDTALILIGRQGIGKSTFFRILAGEWFVDSTIDIHSKDAYTALQKAWVFEWAELETLRRSRDVESAKAFLSSSEDTYRPSYGRFTVTKPRCTVIVGTSNEDRFLSDTENRRFWTVRVAGRLNEALLVEWRDQLWAEAVYHYRCGCDWWLNSDQAAQLAELHAEHHMEQDPWEDTLIPELNGYEEILAIEIKKILDPFRAAAGWSRTDDMRISKIMRSRGYYQHKKRVNGGIVRVWKK